MDHTRAFLVLAVCLLSACPGETPRPRQDVSLLLPDGPGRDGPPSFVDGQTPSPDGKIKLPDGKIKPPLDSTPKTPDQAKPSQDWGANDIGKPCTSNSECIHGLCAQNTHTGVNFCTKTCDPCVANPCPTGSGCQNAGLAYICAPGYPNAACPP